MKKILSLLFIFSLFVGCEKDFLEVPPLDRISENAVWTDQNLVQAFVNAQYNVVQDHFGNNLHYYADEAYSPYNPGGSWHFRQNTLTQDVSLSGELNLWNTAYSYLRNINIFFEKIENTQGFDESVVLSMKGEMTFLRAYIYQILLYSYGGVPIIDKVFKLDEDLTGITRNSYQEVFNKIMADLDFVIEESNLPDKQSGSNWGRASKDVARAMKSRLLLRDASAYYTPVPSVAKWQAASDAAWELIDSKRYSLWTGDYAKMFLTAGNSEAIWQKLRTTASSTNYPYFANAPTVGGFGNHQPTENLSQAYEMTNGELPYLTEGSLTPVINPASGFDSTQYWVNRDARWYAMFGYNGRIWGSGTIYTWKGVVSQDLSYTGYYTVKYIDQAGPWASNYPYTTPYTIYRYAEILLNYAEAQFELGFEDVARDYLNMIRRRAGQPDISASVTGSELRNKIRHERRVEFPYEGLRYYDIRRWDIAEEVSKIPIIGMQITNLGTKASPGPYNYKWVELLPGFWDDKQFLIPIPYAEIQKSGGSLAQNPGY